jgi:signal transduction histidine kinase
MVSWPVFWVTLLGNALLPGLLTSQMTGLTWGNRLITMIVTQVAVWMVILGGWLISARVERGWWAVIITALAAAGARGVVIGALLPVLGVSSSSTGLLRVVMSIATMGFLIVACSMAVARSREYHAECDRLSLKQAELLAARQEALRLSQLDEDRLSEEVATSLQAAITGISGLDRMDAAQRLRAIGDETVRPLAHSLVRSLQEEQDAVEGARPPVTVPPLALRTILVATLHPSYIRPLLVALACAFLPLAAAVNRFGVREALVVCGVVFLSILLSGLAVRALLARLARPGTVLGVVMLVLALALMTLAFAIPFMLVTNTPIVIAALAGGATITVVTVLLAMGHAFAERREQVLRQLAEENSDLMWQIARTNGVRWVRQRTTARALHGPIQSALTVAALRLEDEVRGGGDSEELTAEAARWLNGIVEELAGQREQNTSLAEHMALVSETWSGQCQSTIDWVGITPDAIDADPVCATIIADLVIEGFSNAVRHGEATNIQVSLERVGSEVISVCVRDNGTSGDADAGTGLGMAYLDDVTRRHAFTRDDSGGLMTADIPFVPRHRVDAIRG